MDKFPGTRGKVIGMTCYEYHRLNRYIADIQHRLLVIRQILRYPLTSNQAAAGTMAKATVVLVDEMRQQILKENYHYLDNILSTHQKAQDFSSMKGG